MSKNKFKIITLLIVVILALTLPIVRAENETTDDAITSNSAASENASDTNTEAINLDAEGNSTTDATTEENFKKNDVYLTGDQVTIDYIIDGNLFVIANDVTINSQVGGDAFICANNVTIGEQGYIFSNLFTLSDNVNINGVVYDLYTASKNTTINGYIYRDIHVGSNTLNVFGTIGRNAYVTCDHLNFTQNADASSEETTNATSRVAINGNLTYSSSQEISIPEGVINGEISFEQKTSFNESTILDQIMNLGTFVITIVAVWLLCLWLTPKFLKKTTSLLTMKKILSIIGLGIITPIILILLTVLFFILGITSTLGLLLLILLFALITISTAIFTITLNSIICKKLKIEKTLITFGILIATSVVLWLIGLIPYIGSILGIIVVILGLGITVSSLVFKKKNEEIH